MTAAELTKHVASRAMTPAEIRMARALGCCRAARNCKYRSAIIALHLSAVSERPSISAEMASILRACVLTFKSVLPADVVAIVGTAQ